MKTSHLIKKVYPCYVYTNYYGTEAKVLNTIDKVNTKNPGLGTDKMSRLGVLFDGTINLNYYSKIQVTLKSLVDLWWIQNSDLNISLIKSDKKNCWVSNAYFTEVIFTSSDHLKLPKTFTRSYTLNK